MAGASPGGGSPGQVELVGTDAAGRLAEGQMGSFSSHDTALSPVRSVAGSGVKSVEGEGGDRSEQGEERWFLGQWVVH